MFDPVLIGTWIPLKDVNKAPIPESAIKPFLVSVTMNSPKTRVCVMGEKLGFRLGVEYGLERVRLLQEILPGMDAEHVILTDLRDVVVQKDLHEFPLGRLGFHLEAKGTTIKDCPYNAPWIQAFYGQDMLDKIGHNPISNVSMVSGPKSDVIRYVATLAAIMAEAGPAPDPTRWASGIDMAAHNVLVWLAEHGGVVHWEKPPIYTCGSMDRIVVDHHKILDENGDVPFMVHQYDRHIGTIIGQVGWD